MQIIAASRIVGKVGALFCARGHTFVTEPVEQLELSFDGVKGDHHCGITRRTSAREPWYPRGTELRNERQLTLLCAKELAAVAEEMSIEAIRPEWIGGNMLIEGIPNLSMLPASTLLFFEGGATLKVDFQNEPCKTAGAAIADHYPAQDHTGLSLQFVSAAKRRRGLLAWVEKPGKIVPGEMVRVKIPEQWIYSAS